VEGIGINATLLMAQFCNFALLLVWPLLSIAALVYLSKRKLPDTPKVLWAILIVLVPFLGAFAVWIVKPGESMSPESERP
jgi:uncharacterized membrane protein YhaH (DUF805 family)